MTRYDYLLLLKILMNNILYDDNHDENFLFNYNPINKLNPSSLI